MTSDLDILHVGSQWHYPG